MSATAQAVTTNAEQIVPDWYRNSIKKYIISVWPEAPMVYLKKATKSPAAICVREIWCFSPAVHPRRGWHTWVSTSKTGSLFMQVPAKGLLSVASTNNTIRNTGFAAAE